MTLLDHHIELLGSYRLHGDFLQSNGPLGAVLWLIIKTVLLPASAAKGHTIVTLQQQYHTRATICLFYKPTGSGGKQPQCN
jgi:hypothetical protein